MTAHPLALVRRNALATLRPPPRISIADWIEANVYLPPTASALPGRIRLWEYQRGILEALEDPDIHTVVVSKSARVGFTVLIAGLLGYYVANAPSPILAVQPTADDARDFSVDVEALFEASPTLRGLLSDEADESGRSTMMNRRFAGGSLKYLAARAPRAFRRLTAKIALADEVDGYDVTAEGNVLDLLKMRTQTFRDRKLFYGSTPIFDYGAITRLYAESDRRVFEVQCPECDDFTEILWQHITWDSGKPDTAAFTCPHCGSLVGERHKPAMVANGRWRATGGPVAGVAGFRLNSLVSPHANASWANLAAEFIKAKDDPTTLQTFTNLCLGQPWKSGGEELSEGDLLARREAFGLEAIPADLLFLTLGVDVQDDRLAWTLVGHGRTELFVLASGNIFGRYDADETWRDLDDLLKMTWQHPGGARIGVSAALIDEGDGEHQPTVRAFCRPRFARRIASSKGLPGFSRAPLERSSQKGATLFLLGVDALKAQLFSRLAAGRQVRFSADLQPVYFEELTSERRVVRYSRGQPTSRFERIPGKRAESLDSTVYAIAARQLIGADPDRRATELSSAAAPRPIAPTVVRSSWLKR